MVRKAIDFTKTIFTSEPQSTLKVSVILMGITLLAKVAGLAVKALMANKIGVNRELDIFFAANTLPEMLSNVFLVGALSAAVIPILAQVKKVKGFEEFEKTLSLGLNGSLLLFTAITIVVSIFAGQIIPWIIQNFANPIDPFTPGEISRIVIMTRVLLFSQILLGVSSFIGVGLQTMQRFIIPQIAGILYNIGQLIGAILIIPLLPNEYKLWGLVIGIYLGCIFHILIQLPAIRAVGIKYYPILDFKNAAVRKMAVLGIPRTLTLAADQFAVAFDKVIALRLIQGSLSAYALSISIMSIPFSLVAYSFSVVAFPKLAEHFAANDKNSARDLFTKVFNQILFLVIPITAIFIVLRVPLVRIMYGLYPNGNFSWDATLLIAWMILFYSIGLVPEVLNTLHNRLFFSAHNTWIPLLIGAFIVIFGMGTGLAFTQYLKHFDTLSILDLTINLDFFKYNASSVGIAAVGGLALSSSITNIIAFIFFMIAINVKLFKLTFHDFWLKIIAKTSVGISMFSFMYIITKFWESTLNTAKVSGVILLTGGTILFGGLLYVGLSILFKIEEADIFKRYYERFRKYIITR
ncbi:MAG: lipid II flippase MurJ [bacterium]